MAVLPKVIYQVFSPIALRRFRRACRNPLRAQSELLQYILQENSDTRFGREHKFAEIFTLEEFQAKVPINTYEKLAPYIKASMNGEERQLTKEKPILYSTTSGTTGDSKYIPVTPSSREAKAKLMRVWLAALYRDHPGMFDGKILPIVSPEEESRAPDGTPCGAESGHGYKNIPRFIKSLYACPYEVFKIKDYHARYYAILRIAAEQSLSLLYTCNPSTLVLLGELMQEFADDIIRDISAGTLRSTHAEAIDGNARRTIEAGLGKNVERAMQLTTLLDERGELLPRDVWPELAAIGCWKGGTVSSYLEEVKRMYGDVPVRDIGYFASEMRASVPLSDDSSAGVLAVETNLYEFSKLEGEDADEEPNPTELLTVEDLEVGERYTVYVTTMGGLYRYDMKDVIEVVDMYENTPVIRFVRKTKGVVSFTGEKLSETHVLKAAEATFDMDSNSAHFIALVGDGNAKPPHYTAVVEFARSPAGGSTRELLEAFERALRDSNIEYQSKRDSMRLGPPTLFIAEKGAYNRFRRRQVEGGRTDAQFKLLRLTDDTSLLEEFSCVEEVRLEEDSKGGHAAAAG